MTQRFLEAIKERTLVFDGAMGSLLLAAIPAGQETILSNVKQPEIVTDIHRRYIEAGADVITTNTLGGNAIKLSSTGSADQFHELNEAAVTLAKSVCPPGRFVAGNLGPTGQFLKPLGEISESEMIEAYVNQTEVLTNAGSDVIIIETMFSLEECLAALKGAKQRGSVPVIASMTFSKTQKGFYTMMGEGVAQTISALEAGGVDVVATNCSLGSRDMIALTVEMSRIAHKPILVQPNAGEPKVKNDVATIYEQTPSQFAADMINIQSAGADMVGGCCGTTPDFISELVKMRDNNV